MGLLKEKKSRSKTAVVVTSLYLVVLAAALAVMFMTKDDTAMSGIFLVFVTVPWSLVVTWLQEMLHFDSITFATLLLVAGGLLNSILIYKIISFLMRKLQH